MCAGEMLRKRFRRDGHLLRGSWVGSESGVEEMGEEMGPEGGVVPTCPQASMRN